MYIAFNIKCLETFYAILTKGHLPDWKVRQFLTRNCARKHANFGVIVFTEAPIICLFIINWREDEKVGVYVDESPVFR